MVYSAAIGMFFAFDGPCHLSERCVHFKHLHHTRCRRITCEKHIEQLNGITRHLQLHLSCAYGEATKSLYDGDGGYSGGRAAVAAVHILQIKCVIFHRHYDHCHHQHYQIHTQAYSAERAVGVNISQYGSKCEWIIMVANVVGPGVQMNDILHQFGHCCRCCLLRICFFHTALAIFKLSLK